MQRRRSAFTLLEVLVVIGVILILISLAVIGFQVVERSAAANQTKVTLDNLNSMLAELEATAGSNALPTYSYYDPVLMKSFPQPVIGIGITGPAGQAWEIGDVTSGQADRSGFIVQQTQGAMASLMRVPNNAKAIAAFPTSKILKDSNGNPYTIPVLLDGWGNPIIYVPRGGMIVYVTTGNGNTPTQITVAGKANRPFFASAGPDGDFGARTGATQAKGDDNIYSKD